MKIAALISLFFILGAAASATTRTSTDYTVVADVLDSGGGQGSSGDYSNSGSVGEIVGISTYPSAPMYEYMDKSGYLGQLYEITGLAVTAPTDPATVFGGYTLQLSASASLDDSTTLGVLGGGVVWSVTTGNSAIPSISANGLATAAPVTQNSSATIQGVYSGFSGSLDVTVEVATAAIKLAVADTSQMSPGNLDLVGSLEVILDDPMGKPYPARVQGSVPGWRFVGESSWRSSGATVTGLSPGQFPLEFESIVNFGPPATIIPAPAASMGAVTAGTTSEVTYQYPAAGSVTGSVAVDIFPSGVTASNLPIEQTAQWRLSGETVWRNSGTAVAGLPLGSYDIQFKTVPGYAPVADHEVQVTAGAGLFQGVTVTYQAVQAVSGVLPAPLSFSKVTGQSPYDFVGQIASDFLIDNVPTPVNGSGTVVAQRVVLTAAHVIFDDATLSMATDGQWQFERYAGQLEPAALIPRGALVLDGYAASRKGQSPGVGTPQSEQLDAAVLYFQQNAGNGGFSGYLVSNSASEWLLTDRSMTLVGYPVDIGQPNSTVIPGEMQATPEQTVAFATLVTQQPDVYVTSQITGLAGMSGGPLCVQFDNGVYYPAGIYLGGNQQCIVHGIDATVQALIQQAQVASGGGANHVGGGSVVVESISTASSFETGSVTVNFGAGSPGKAGWRFSTEADGVSHAGGVALNGLPTGVSETIVFASVPGYAAPPDYGPFSLSPGESLVLAAGYGSHPVITTAGLPIGGVGLKYATQLAATNSPTKFAGTLTDPLGIQVALSATHPNASSLNLVLSDQGILSTAPGTTIPPGATIGIYTLAVSATNSAPGAGAVTLELVIAPTGTLSVNFDSSQGSVALGGARLKTGQTTLTLPQGAPVTLTATPILPNYLFGGWTGSGTASVPVSSQVLQLTMTSAVELNAGFETNPFLSLAGIYNGLLSGDVDALPARGYLAAEVTEFGVCTLSFYVGGQHFSARDVFQATNGGNQAATLLHVIKGTRGASNVTINLQLDPVGTTDALAGTVTVNGFPLALSANQAVFSARSPAPPALGERASVKYTMALPHSVDTGAPQGDGYGRVTVTPAGAVHFAGMLGDGTAVSEGTNLGPVGQWPFYALLYASTGVITGPLTITATGTTGSIGGNLDWFKPVSKAQYYPDGFTISSGLGDAIAVQGLSLGTAPLAGLSQATLGITGGGLSASVPSIMAAISSKGVGSANGLKGFAFSISPTTGLFTGKFLDESAVSHTFNGVLLPAGGGTAHGFGLFKGAPHTGKVDSPPGDTGAVEF